MGQQQNFMQVNPGHEDAKIPRKSATELCKIKSIKYISKSRDDVYGEVHVFSSTT